MVIEFTKGTSAIASPTDWSKSLINSVNGWAWAPVSPRLACNTQEDVLEPELVLVALPVEEAWEP